MLGRCFGRFLRDESGTAAIEYSLVVAGISITIFAVVQAWAQNRPH
jgi:Flp pilus assembly pilin Flp